jgi:hypothetical protein
MVQGLTGRFMPGATLVNPNQPAPPLTTPSSTSSTTSSTQNSTSTTNNNETDNVTEQMLGGRNIFED